MPRLFLQTKYYRCHSNVSHPVLKKVCMHQKHTKVCSYITHLTWYGCSLANEPTSQQPSRLNNNQHTKSKALTFNTHSHSQNNNNKSFCILKKLNRNAQLFYCYKYCINNKQFENITLFSKQKKN
jgi:hypothetical protein